MHVDDLLSLPFDPLRHPFWASVHARLQSARAGRAVRASLLDACIDKLILGGALSDADARQVMDAILGGTPFPDDQIGALLVLLPPDQLPARTIAAFAQAVRDRAARFPSFDEPLADTCGTGGGGLDTYNVSTAVMFILAAGRARIAKHGNRAITSRAGSADVLEALGASIELGPEQVAECIRTVGAGFLFAPRFHQSFKNVQKTRKLLAEEMPAGVPRKTVFNVLGPLANPASASHQVVGVFDEGLVEKFAEALRILGVERALVAHGRSDAKDKGMDEFSTAGATVYAELRDGRVEMKLLEPEDAGVERLADPSLVSGGDKDQNARTLRGVLLGNETPARIELALLNAGAGLYLCGKAHSIAAGVNLARHIIKSGAAATKLDEFVAKTRALADA